MRVLVLTTSYPRAPEDHAGIFVARACEALAARGHAVTVLAPGAPEAWEWEHVRGVRVRRVPYFRPRRWMGLAYGGGGIPQALRARPWVLLQAPFLALAMLGAALREARSGVDVVHAHWGFAGLVARLLRRLTGLPYVLTLQGTGDGTGSGPLAALGRKAEAGAAVVASVNERFAAERIAAGADPARIRTVSAGVEIRTASASARAAARRELGIAEDETALLFVGDLIPRKGVDLFPEALSAIPRERRVRLHALGDAARGEALMERARALGAEDRLRILGRVAPSKVGERLDAADLFVFPSFSEGRPNALLEAMGAGVPAVASDLPEIRELIEEGRTGLLFPAGDAKALAARIEELLEDPGRARAIGAAAREEIRRRALTWEACAEAYERAYEEARRR